MNAVEIEEAISALAERPFDSNQFPYAFLEAFGNKETTLNRDHVDIIIALGMAKEGFDWIWCEHALTVGYRSSLTEIVQIIGRATRDAPGKTRARFTNLIAEPDASEAAVTEAVNDTLKAIAASLLMEQVLAPRFEFKPKNPGSGPTPGFDYGDGGYDPHKCNVGFNEDSGQFQIEIKGLATPKSEEATRICQQDLNEVIAAFVQDKTNIERGLFDEELARHLLAQENEATDVIEIRGVVACTSLAEALHEMRAISLGTRSRRPLYHASINLDRAEAGLTDGQWLGAVDELERHLGLVGHARAVLRHVKRGRAHVHCVWSRIDPITLRVVHDSQNYLRHERCARELERRWRLNPVTGVHTRVKGTSRPVAAATHGCWQAQERTGIRVDEVSDKLRRAWTTTTTAAAFKRAVEAKGWCLANGRRGIVLVDEAGTPHSLPRRLNMKAAEVRRRLAVLDATALPTVDDAKQAAKGRREPGRNTMPRRTSYGASGTRRKADRRLPDDQPLSPDYWRRLGFEVDVGADALIITLSPTTRLEDRGDRLALIRDGEPTDAEIAVLVAAGRERGWQQIRFSGGSPEFQRRARLEALRQGFRLDQISLECEDGQPKPLAAQPLPNHLKRRLLPAPQPEQAPAAPVPDAPAPTPAPEFRP